MAGAGKVVVVGAWMLGISAALLPLRAQQGGVGSAGGGVGGGGGAEGSVMMVPRLSSPPTFDGVVDDAVWDTVEPLPLVQYWPTPGADMSFPTEIRVGYDDRYLYAAGRFYDEPGGVRANSFGRDRWDGDDSFELLVDSFNDNETALKFTVMPLGALMDEEVQNDANRVGEDWPLNMDWNGYWEALTHQTDEGWFTEMRIPLSTLGFEAEDGRVVMGIIAARYIARLNEKHIFPALAPDVENAEFKPSLAQDVELLDVESGPPLHATPYLLSGADRTREPELGPSASTRVPREAGLDVKWGLTSNLTLDLTMNTDFAQVESDAFQTNLDRFNLFFPEKRQFFQERAGVFQFRIGDETRLFHSRRIGLSEQGQPRRILGGARLVGRVGSWDVGVLSMQVDGLGDVVPENDGAIRLRRSVFNDLSTVGAMVTTRATSRGVDTSVGVDGEINVGGQNFVSGHFAQTYNTGEPADQAAGFGARSMARFAVQNRRAEGLAFDTEVAYSGAAFDPRLGFEERGDFAAFKGRLAYSWSPEDSRVARHRSIFTTRAFTGSDGGGVESLLGRLRHQVSFKSGHFWNTALNVTWDDVQRRIELPGGHVEPGSYGGANLWTNFWLNRAMPLSAEGNFWVGRFMDGWRLNVRMAPTWTVSKHLSVTAAYDYHRLWFSDRDQRVDADQASLRLAGALNAHLSAETFLQYSMAADRMAANVRLRYRFSEGRDLYVVLDGARDIALPLDERLRLGGTSDRRLLVKYAHTLRR